AGAAIALPAVCTITWATMTSPLLVPAGTPRAGVQPPEPLLPEPVARRDMPPPNGGVGVGVGVGCTASAGTSALRCVICDLVVFPARLVSMSTDACSTLLYLVS